MPLPPWPTALAHLLGVELLPVYGFGMATWSAGTHFLAHKLLATRFVGLVDGPAPTAWPRDSSSSSDLPPTLLEHVDCLGEAVADFLWSKGDGSANRCPGCGVTMECPATFPLGVLPLLVYGSLTLTALLIGLIVGLFAMRGLCCHRAGNGAYLWFTWELETRPVYKVIVKTMLLATVISMATAFLALLTEGGRHLHHSLLSMVLMDALAFVICLWKLLVPKTGVHHWIDGQQLCRCHFKRSWFRLPHVFPESNDSFASKLLDALWQAKHGRRRLLRQMALDPKDADAYVAMLGSMVVGRAEEGESGADAWVELPEVEARRRSRRETLEREASVRYRPL